MEGTCSLQHYAEDKENEFAVAIHIPGYLKSFEVTLNGMRLKENSETKADEFYSYRDGYIYIKINGMIMML